MDMAQTAPHRLVALADEVVGQLDGGMGYLRRRDIRQRIRQLVADYEMIEGRPAGPADAPDIARLAVANAFAAEIAAAIRGDAPTAVQIAFAVLEDAGCHAEAAALRQAAETTGMWR